MIKSVFMNFISADQLAGLDYNDFEDQTKRPNQNLFSDRLED